MSLAKFEAVRVTRSWEHRVPLPPEKVFPLLCPVREREWLPGSKSHIVYLASGYAEQGGVFASDLPDRGQGLWVISRHEPNRTIGFVVFCANAYVEQIEVTVMLDGEDGARLGWRRVYTGLSERGNLFLRETTGAPLDRRMATTIDALERHCADTVESAADR